MRANAGREPDADAGMWKTKFAIAVALVLVLAGLYWWLRESGALAVLGDQQALQAYIQRIGIWGPLGIIVLMTGAIVMSPIPSGPIAMVAGAAFGPVLGLSTLSSELKREPSSHSGSPAASVTSR